MKCEICGKEILRDSQCINYKYYHNDCIENLQQENKQLKEKVNKLEILIENLKLGVTLNQEQEDLLDEYTLFDDVKDYAKQLKSYNKLCIKSSFTTRKLNNLNSILIELEKWCNDGIKDELVKIDYGTEIIGAPIKIHITSYEMVLDKIQKLKEKYK